MAFDFPLTPTVGDEYTLNGVSYVWTGETWDVKSTTTAMTDYVLKAGDTMTGPLVLPAAMPTALQHATHKQYVDEAIARQSLYQSAWQVAANVPDLTPAVVNALHNYSWVAVTVDPIVAEVAPAALPGIGGKTIATNDTIIWNATLALYEHLPTPPVTGAYVLKTGDTMTGALTVNANIEGTGHLQTTGGIYSTAGHIYARSGSRFLFQNTDNNAWQNAFSMNGGIHLQYHQGGNNDGRLRIYTSNGGYTDTWVMETTIVSGYPGIKVNGSVEARQLINRDGTHIMAAQVDGYGIQFHGGAYIYKRSGYGVVFRKHTANTQFKIEQNDGTGLVDIATTSLAGRVEDQIEERVQPLLDRIAQLEARLAQMEAR
jgi:hypothetical protein